MRQRQRQVRFSQKNDTHWIEPRQDLKKPPSDSQTTPVHDRRNEVHDTMIPLDDEVKGHPIFSEHSSTSYIASVTQQLQQNPQCKTIFNPITQRTITRFGKSYWNLMVTLFGIHSFQMKQEKETYRQWYKKQ